MTEWLYDEDNGSVMCRCPECGGRLTIGLYQYRNPYKFCPYCGIKLEEGKITAKRKQVYGLGDEDRGRSISLSVSKAIVCENCIKFGTICRAPYRNCGGFERRRNNAHT